MTEHQTLKVSIRDVSDPECGEEFYAPADEVAKRFDPLAGIILHPEFGHLEYTIEFEHVRIECANF